MVRSVEWLSSWFKEMSESIGLSGCHKVVGSVEWLGEGSHLGLV